MPSDGTHFSSSASASQLPLWFTTDNPSYQAILHNEYNQGQTAHNLASLFCHIQNLFLCTHSDYCSDGALFAEPSSGAASAAGPAPIQWAPMFPDAATGTGAADDSWVQVDHYGAGEGKCYSYSAWTRGAGKRAEEAWGENHRKWVLCCETMSEQERWEKDNLR